VGVWLVTERVGSVSSNRSSGRDTDADTARSVTVKRAISALLIMRTAESPSHLVDAMTHSHHAGDSWCLGQHLRVLSVALQSRR
jgi:hypothetical protein